MLVRSLCFLLLASTPALAIEACAIVRAADLMVVGKLNAATLVRGLGTVRISGRLHVAGIVSGEAPAARQLEYAFDCEDCRRFDQRDARQALRFLATRYGVWLLSNDGGVWTAAFPRSTDPGYRPLERLDNYKNCLQGRRFSGGD